MHCATIKMLSGDLHHLCFLPDNIRMNRSRKIRETERVARILVGKPEGSRSLAKPTVIVDAGVTLKLI